MAQQTNLAPFGVPMAPRATKVAVVPPAKPYVRTYTRLSPMGIPMTRIPTTDPAPPDPDPPGSAGPGAAGDIIAFVVVGGVAYEIDRFEQ